MRAYTDLRAMPFFGTLVILLNYKIFYFGKFCCCRHEVEVFDFTDADCTESQHHHHGAPFWIWHSRGQLCGRVVDDLQKLCRVHVVLRTPQLLSLHDGLRVRSFGKQRIW